MKNEAYEKLMNLLNELTNVETRDEKEVELEYLSAIRDTLVNNVFEVAKSAKRADVETIKAVQDVLIATNKQMTNINEILQITGRVLNDK